ncbi:hypothetical protein CapIbe_020020 [Capra ibex]
MFSEQGDRGPGFQQCERRCSGGWKVMATASSDSVSCEDPLVHKLVIAKNGSGMLCRYIQTTRQPEAEWMPTAVSTGPALQCIP